MTFGERLMDGDDGAQSWDDRKNASLETIRLHRPALLGTQEIFPGQTSFILDCIPEPNGFGRGRFGDNRNKIF
jgi:hypothetical protein